MNSYILSKIIDYIKQSKVKISFERTCSGESSLLFLVVTNVKTGETHKFKITNEEKKLIELIIDLEEL